MCAGGIPHLDPPCTDVVALRRS